jgi:rubrerythrin
MAYETIANAKSEKFWADIGISHARVHDTIRFARYIQRFPILLSLPVSYNDIHRYGGKLMATIETDTELLQLLEQRAVEIKLEFKSFTIPSMNPDNEINIRYLKKTKTKLLKKGTSKSNEKVESTNESEQYDDDRVMELENSIVSMVLTEDDKKDEEDEEDEEDDKKDEEDEKEPTSYVCNECQVALDGIPEKCPECGAEFDWS